MYLLLYCTLIGSFCFVLFCLFVVYFACVVCVCRRFSAVTFVSTWDWFGPIAGATKGCSPRLNSWTPPIHHFHRWHNFGYIKHLPPVCWRCHTHEFHQIQRGENTCCCILKPGLVQHWEVGYLLECPLWSCKVQDCHYPNRNWDCWATWPNSEQGPLLEARCYQHG